MTRVCFYDRGSVPDEKLTYSVIVAAHKGRWIFVRHTDRDTWEIAGGHIERHESPDEAAERELREETGAEEFTLCCVSTYSVQADDRIGYGNLYFAEVSRLGPVPDVSEIAEIMLADTLPFNLTYPEIQPRLFSRVQEFLRLQI